MPKASLGQWAPGTMRAAAATNSTTLLATRTAVRVFDGFDPPGQHEQRPDGHAVERHEGGGKRQAGRVAHHRDELTRWPRPAEEQLARLAQRLLERDRRRHHQERAGAGQPPRAEQGNRHQQVLESARCAVAPSAPPTPVPGEAAWKA